MPKIHLAMYCSNIQMINKVCFFLPVISGVVQGIRSIPTYFSVCIESANFFSSIFFLLIIVSIILGWLGLDMRSDDWFVTVQIKH